MQTWLENATSSLISWGVDARAATGSLSAVEGTLLENEVRYALCELKELLEKIYKDGKLQAQESTFQTTESTFQAKESIFQAKESTFSANDVSELSPTFDEDRFAADEDPMALMSSLIVGLQATVRPIRMIYASNNQEGPYRELKRQVDDMYNQHIKRRDQGKLLAPKSPSNEVLHDNDRSRDPADVKDLPSHSKFPATQSASSNYWTWCFQNRDYYHDDWNLQTSNKLLLKSLRL